VISIEAEHFTRKKDVDGFSWRVINGFGKTGDSVSVFPNAAKTFTELTAASPYLEYQINVARAGDFNLGVYLIPTHPLIAGTGLRLAYSVDDRSPQIVTVDENVQVSSAKWSTNVLSETTVGTSKIRLEKGSHTLRVFAVDTGVILDKIVLNDGPVQPSYFGPPETLAK